MAKKNIKTLNKGVRSGLLEAFVFFGVLLLAVFLSIDEYSLAVENNLAGQSNNNSETIYSFQNCDTTGCNPWYYDSSGNKVYAKELFKFYGANADCAGYYEDCKEKTDCSSLSAGDCNAEINQCTYAENTSCQQNYSHGQAGTMEIAGSLQVEGNETYLTGAGEGGKHWIKTGEGQDDKVLGVDNETADPHFAGTLSVGGDIQMQNSSDISWGNHPESEEMLKVDEEGYSFVSNDNTMMQVSSGGVKADNLEVNSDQPPKAGMKPGGKLKTESVTWEGDTGAKRVLGFTPEALVTPGYNVYFYCDPAISDWSEAAGCE